MEEQVHLIVKTARKTELSSVIVKCSINGARGRGSELCVTRTEEKGHGKSCGIAFPLKHLLAKTCSQCTSFCLGRDLIVRLFLNVWLWTVTALHCIRERENALQVDLGEINFCRPWKQVTNMNNCLTYEILIRWLINYVCGKRKLVNGWLEDSESTGADNKRNLVQRVMLGWVFPLPLCPVMVNTELFARNSLGVREPVISIEHWSYVLVCYVEA